MQYPINATFAKSLNLILVWTPAQSDALREVNFEMTRNEAVALVEELQNAITESRG